MDTGAGVILAGTALSIILVPYFLFHKSCSLKL